MRRAGGSASQRRRLRATVAITVLSAWFGSLLLSAPLTGRANAAGTVTDPTVTGPTTGRVYDPTYAITPDADNDPVECGWRPAGATTAVAWAACSATYTPTLDPTESSFEIWFRSRRDVVTDVTPSPSPTTSDTSTATVAPSPTTVTTTTYSTGFSTPYTIDTSTITVQRVSGPDGTTGTDPAVTWQFDGGAGTTTTCSLAAGGSAVGTSGPCGAGQPYPADPLPADGVYTVTATASGPGGATGSASATYTLDRSTPVVGIAPGTSSGTNPTPGWTVTATDDTATTVTCSLDGAPATDCAAFAAWTAPAEGSYTLTATATDAAGNVGTATATYTYDIAPSQPVITSPPTGNGASVTWTVSTQASATITCSVAGPGGFTATPTCPPGSGQAVTVALPTGPGVDGAYVLTVTATDAGGSSSASGSYLLDRTPPAAPVFDPAATSGSQHTATVSWPFTVSEGTAVCRLVQNGTPGAPLTCATTYTLPNPGIWWLRVTVTDAAGNATTGDGPQVNYDTTPPAPPVVTRTSASPTNVTATTWSLTDTKSNVTYTCWWTGPGGWSTTAGTCPAAYSFALPATNGAYTLHVTATDPAGNTSLESTGSVTYDDVAPTITVSTPSTPRNDPAVTWAVTADETLQSQRCRVVQRTATGDTNPGWTVCGTSFSASLSGGDGTYVLQVSATDLAGNSTGVESAPVVLDTAGPADLPTVDGSTGWSPDPHPSWTITPPTGSDAPAAYACQLVKDSVEDPSAWLPCDPAQPYAPTLTADGTYRLDVLPLDALGNRGQVVSGPDYHFDTTAPAAPQFGPVPATGNATSQTWTWTTGEPGLVATCDLVSVAGSTRTVVRSTPGCASPRTEALATSTPGTSYLLRVTLTDAAGNATAADGPAYLLDTVAPDAPQVHGPTGRASKATASYDFLAAEPGTRAECRMTYAAAGTVDVPAPVTGWAACTSTWSTTLTAGDGRYRAEVHVIDAAGNVSVPGQSEIYELDTTGPAAVTFTAGPTGTANQPAVSWTWSGEDPSTGACTLRRTAPGATTPTVVDVQACDAFGYPTTLAAGDGTYTLTVQLTDPYGNAGASATSAPYELDTTPPAAPAVTGPPATGNATSVSYGLVGPLEPGATAECRLTRDGTVVEDWAGCVLPRTVDLGVDGSYVLSVRLTDAYGNLGSPGASSAYLLDTKPPTAPAVTAPVSPSSSGTPQFTFVTDPDTTTTCRLLGGSTVVAGPTACSGAFTGDLTGQPDGSYVLEVTAKDPAGNTSTGRSAGYVLDTTKPDAPVVTGPSGPSQNRTPTFSWTAESGATAECALREDKTGASVAWTSCSTPYAPALPSDGTWVLSVRLADAAHNVSDTGASGGYLLDTTPPPAPVVTAPSSPGRDLAPSWSAAVEEGAQTECRLSGPGQLGGWGPCTLPLSTPLTGEGSYTLEVRAIDAAGNVSLAGAAGYVLDVTPPGAPVVTPPAGPGRSRTPSIAFTTEPGSSGICKLSRGSTVLSPATACASPAALDLSGAPDGAYTLTVRAVDAAGNVGPAGTATYVLDTTAPVAPTFTLVAGSPSSNRAPVFGWSAERGATVACRLSSPGGVTRDLACSSPLTLDLLNAVTGSYVLAVHATDQAGNAGPAATVTYAFDSTAPVAPSVVGPATPGSNRNPTWRISSTAPAECRLLRGTTTFRDWSACGTSYAADLFNQPDAVYLLEARVVGSTAATSSRYRLDTSGPPAATVVAPPSPSTVRRPVWAVASAETDVTAECRLQVFAAVLKDWAPCAVSPAGSLYAADLTGAGDGTYSLLVRLTDSAGNVGEVVSADYVLDTSAPAAVGVIAPPSPGNDATPTWTLTSAPGVQLECRVSSGQLVIQDFAPCAGTITADLTGLPDGTYTLTVHALSAAGTPGADTTSSYVLDTTAAAAPGVLAGPASPSRDRAPRWTFTLPAGATATCTVVFGGKVFRAGPCSSPYVLDLSSAADGTYTLTVRAVDPAGNVGPPSTSGYTLKTSPPPAPVFTMEPGSPSSTTSPRWAFGLPRGATGQCRLLTAGAVLEDWAVCSSPRTVTLSGRPDGSYTLQVRAVDQAGNTSAPIEGGYALDRTAPPLALFTDIPVSPGRDSTPTWLLAPPQTAALRVAATTAVPVLECRLTARGSVGGWAACSGSFTANASADGRYTLEVRAVTADGTRGAASSSTYVRDTQPPAQLRFLDPLPPSAGSQSEVSWLWADTEDLVECRLLRAGAPLLGFSPCTPPYVADVGRFGEATYTVEVHAIDAAGNVGPVVRGSYRYDVTAPAAPVFVDRPADRGTAATATWTFAVPVDATAVCVVRRDATVVADQVSCPGSYTLDLRGQTPSTWTLSVRFVDAAGNASAAATGSYRLLAAVPGGVRPPSSGGGGVPAGPAPAPAPSAPAPVGPRIDGVPLHPPLSVLHPLPALTKAVKQVVKQVEQALPGVPGALPGTDVPAVIKNVIGKTITKPQLPLALLGVVLLFLLVQNQIDRRDPKLAAAPVQAEQELTFGPTLMQAPTTWQAGGATA